MTKTATKRTGPWIPAGIALLVVSVALAAATLLTTGTVELVAAVALSILAPAAAIIAATTVHRRLRKRIDLLESSLDEEHTARLERDRIYERFTRDLRVPLSRLSDQSQNANTLDATSATTTDELIGRIAHEAIDVVRQVENLATAAQIDAGTYRPTPTVVQVDQLVTRVVSTAGGCGIDITSDARPTTVWCDPTAIRQILLNILHTAVDAGAASARIDVEERNGLGILSITDDRRTNAGPQPSDDDLLKANGPLSQRIVPALVEYQGATITSTRTLGWANTVIRLPVATPAQMNTTVEMPRAALRSSRSV
jgi:signal transduction histidine kinase